MFTPQKPPPVTDNPKKKSTPKFDGQKDARKEKNALTYPNYWQQRTRSGSTITMDDSNGQESITIQHRSGSMWQFHPDGSVNLTAHNGQYTMVFGENRVMVTGAQEIVVKGAASMLVEGDFDQTIRGDTNFTCDGDFNVNAKNMNMNVRGNIDTLAKNMTTKVEGSISTTAQGSMNMGSDGDMSVASMEGSLALGASTDVGIRGFGSVYVESEGGTHLKSGAGTHIQSDGDTHIKSGGATNLKSGGKTSIQASAFASDADPTHFNSGQSAAASEADSAEKVAFSATTAPAKDVGDFGEMNVTTNNMA